MKYATMIASLCLCVPVSIASAQEGKIGASATEAGTVNSICPIGKEPIVPSAGRVEYKGNQIGLCCPGCGKQFLSWDEARKDEFVAMAVAHREPGVETHGANADGAAEPEAAAWTDLYTLDTCPVSGEKLGSMGDPIVKHYDGREVRFCCSMCIGKFERDQQGYWQKIDQKIIEDQLRYHPAQVCVVSGEPLVEDGEDISTNIVYNNRLVRLCCKMCQREFKEDPAAFIEKLDSMAADAQRESYPLDTCVVGGGELGSMGDPVEMVVAGRLMRFCCASCRPKVEANPAKYVAMIDAAWAAKGGFGEAEHDHAEGESHGGGDHTDHDHGG